MDTGLNKECTFIFLPNKMNFDLNMEFEYYNL